MPRARDMLDDEFDEPTLPLGNIDQSSGSMEKAAKAKPIPAAGYGSCPGCTSGRVALEPHEGHLLWRIHVLRTWSEVPLHCRISGSRLCENPDVERQTKCLCENTPGWRR